MPNVPVPRSAPRWTRGDVGREIGQWIYAEIKEQLSQAGINGRTINAGNVVGVVPPAAVSVSLDDLRDVTAPTPMPGQVLTWDDTFGPEPQWVAADPTGGGSGVGLAGTMHQEFLPAATAITVTLAHVPIVVLVVTRNGVTQSVVDGHYSISGATLTFTDAFDGTDRVVVAYVWDDSSSAGGGMTEAEADAKYVPLAGGTVMTGALSPTPGTHPDLGDYGADAIWGWIYAQVVSITDYFDVQSPSTVATGSALATSLLSESYYRFVTQVDGRMRWGSGSATADVFLERAAANTLGITGNLTVTGTTTVGGKAVAADPLAGNSLVWNTDGFYVPTPVQAYDHRYFYAASTTMADPGMGNFRTNTTAPTPPTQMAIDYRDGDNIDIAPLLAALRTGDTIRVQLQTDSTIWRRVRLTADPVDMTGWYRLDITEIGGAGTVPASGGCLMTFFLTGGASGGMTEAEADAKYVQFVGGSVMTGSLSPVDDFGTDLGTPSQRFDTVRAAYGRLYRDLAINTPTVGTGDVFTASVGSEAYYRYTVGADGLLRWGAGTTDRDVSLGRTAAATLGLTGSLEFVGAGRRITGDFSNAVLADRVLVQTSVTNGNTNFGLIPNGTGIISAFYAYNNATPASSAYLRVLCSDSITVLDSGRPAGSTATLLPLEIRTDNTTRARYHTSGGISFLDATDPGAGAVRVGGKATITGNLGLGSGPYSGWGGSWRVMDFNNGGYAFAVTGSSLYWVMNSYHDGTSWRAVAALNVSQLVQPSNGAFVWYSNPNPGVGGTYVPTMRMNLSATGDLWATGTLTIDGVATFNSHVGVSSTPPAWSGYRAVHVGTFGGGIASGISGNTATFLLRNLYYDGSAWRNIGVETGELLQLANRAFIFLVGTNSGAAGGSSTVTQHAQIDTNGLGLGTVAATATVIFNAARNQDNTVIAQVQNQNNTSSAAAIVQAVSPAGALSMWAFPAAYGAPYGNKGMLRSTLPGGMIIQTTNATGVIEFHTVGGSPAAYFSTGGHLLPGTTNQFDLGDGTIPLRWRTVYAVNAFNTSHSDYKRDWRRMDQDTALRIACDTEVGTFRMRPNGDNDPVAKMVRVGILADRAHSLLSPDGVHVSGQDTACLALAAISALCSRIERLESLLKDRAW